MGSGKGEKNAIWVYAVILFTSAFIVLLLTAYSQIKFNKNLNEYKSQLYSEENAKNDFKMNLGTAMNENKKLNEELKSIKQQLEDAKATLEEESSALKKQQEKSLAATSIYDLLIKAQMEYDKGNILESADILHNKVDINVLQTAGADFYEELIHKIYPKAAEMLYFKGYNDYRNKLYDEAIENLKKAYSYSENEYYSDDCLYFIAYSKYRQGYNNEAKEYLEKLINNFQDSNYRKSAVEFIKGL